MIEILEGDYELGGIKYNFCYQQTYNKFYSKTRLCPELESYISGDLFLTAPSNLDDHYCVKHYSQWLYSPRQCFWFPKQGLVPCTEYQKVFPKVPVGSNLLAELEKLYPNIDSRNFYIYLMHRKDKFPDFESNYLNQSYKSVEPSTAVYKFAYNTLTALKEPPKELLQCLEGHLAIPSFSKLFGSDWAYYYKLQYSRSECVYCPNYGLVPAEKWQDFLGSDFATGKKKFTEVLGDLYPNLPYEEFRNLTNLLNSGFRKSKSFSQHMDSYEYRQYRASTSGGWKSIREIKIAEWLKSINIDYIPSYRDVKSLASGRNFELDLYFPEYKVAVEFNGYFWHSSKYHPKYYHRDKRDSCLAVGISLVTIWEDTSLDLCKSIILSKLGKSFKIYARNTICKEISVQKANSLLGIWHTDGACSAFKAWALFTKDNRPLSVLTLRYTIHGVPEIARFASAYQMQVIGGYSKLLKRVISYLKSQQYKALISYCNSDLSCSPEKAVYSKLGFKFIKDSGPILKYYVSKPINLNQKHYSVGIYPRQVFQKHKLKYLPLYSDTLTEQAILAKYEIYAVYNSGNFRFEYTIS